MAKNNSEQTPKELLDQAYFDLDAASKNYDAVIEEGKNYASRVNEARDQVLDARKALKEASKELSKGIKISGRRFGSTNTPKEETEAQPPAGKRPKRKAA